MGFICKRKEVNRLIQRIRHRLPAAAAILLLLIAAAVLGGRYISNEYHTYYRDSVREYETSSYEHGSLVLRTERRELLSKVYAAFTVSDKDSGELIYRCPDLYPVGDLISIHWEDSTGDILVETTDQGTVRYQAQAQRWEKVN